MSDSILANRWGEIKTGQQDKKDIRDTVKFPWGIQTEQREKEKKTAEPLNSCEPGCSTNRPPSESARSGQIIIINKKDWKMTSIGKRKWWSICKDLASAMKTSRQAIIQPSQDGGQIEGSFLEVMNSQMEIQSIWCWETDVPDCPMKHVNERPQRVIEGSKRWDMYSPMIEKGNLKKSV